MRVFLQPPQPDLGLQRIRDALVKYAPRGVEITSFPRHADLTVIYAIGRRDAIQRQVEEILERGAQYAVIQVCLRSTMAPDVVDWLSIWGQAKVVWSYYDLQQAYIDDASDYYGRGRGVSCSILTNFYHAPLGADPQVFKYRETPLKYVVVTSGRNRLQESIRECIIAAERVGKRVFHLGRQVNWGEHVTGAVGISDDELAQHYSASEYVSALRRTEGFELPAVEGLLCGARPITFDTPDYRFNYKHFAEYIKEGTRAEVVEQLVELFSRPARPVTEHEREEAAHWFNWERIVGEFWARCLQ